MLCSATDALTSHITYTGEEKDKTGLAHAHAGNGTNESQGVGDLIGDTNNCVCTTIMLSFCSVACRGATDGLSERTTLNGR